jgi:hypothetical protein
MEGSNNSIPPSNKGKRKRNAISDSPTAASISQLQ